MHQSHALVHDVMVLMWIPEFNEHSSHELLNETKHSPNTLEMDEQGKKRSEFDVCYARHMSDLKPPVDPLLAELLAGQGEVPQVEVRQTLHQVFLYASRRRHDNIHLLPRQQEKLAEDPLIQLGLWTLIFESFHFIRCPAPKV